MLSSGAQVGPYQIVAALGAGGMGEVYRARDPKLDREVAIKVLPEALATDPACIARFDREARTLAALNHPNIAHVYGLEQAGSLSALVMELVAGPTLADLIAERSRGRAASDRGLAIDDVLAIARQIADAFEAAHAHGIIHRDLKPANVKVRLDGTVKVLDFGLAKAIDAGAPPSDATRSPTLSLGATRAGTILGTAAYMSPEQARGRPADKRADVWAFGCVLYEMLTGARAFPGDDVSDTLAAVLRADPDWDALPRALTAPIRLLIQRCLEKDVSRRISDMSVVRFLLTEPAAASADNLTSAGSSARHRTRSFAIAVAATALAVAATAALTWNIRQPRANQVAQFAIVLPNPQQFAPRSQVLAVSPDGTRLAYAGSTGNNGGGQLFIRSLADLDPRPVNGTDLDVMGPVFSPDGEWIVFYSFRDSTLKKIPVTGGTPITLCRADPPYGVTWDGDWLVFADQGAKGILKVSANGGQPAVLIPPKPGEVLAAPQMLDGGQAILFTAAPLQGGDRWDRAQIVMQDIGASERHVLLQAGSEGRYVPTGHLLYMHGTTLLAVPFDRRTLHVGRSPTTLVEGVRRFSANVASPGASFSISAAGTFAYIPGVSGGTVERAIALVTRDGAQKKLDLPLQTYFYPRVSPDGRQLAVQTDIGSEAVISIYDLKRGGPLRRLTFEGQNRYPVWTPDSRRVTFVSDRNDKPGIFWQMADGTQPAERLLVSRSPIEHRPEAWTRDGKTLIVVAPFDRRLFTLSPGSIALTPLSPDLLANESALSPDNKWLAYASTEIGNRLEIFVQPFPPTGAKYQVSTNGGRSPLWSPDGTQIYYWANLVQQFVGVDVQTEPSLRLGNTTRLPVEGLFNATIVARNYDVTPDGRQLVVVTRADVRPADATAPAPRVNVVLNWLDDLKSRVAAR